MYDVWITQPTRNYQHSGLDDITLACGNVTDSCCSVIRNMNSNEARERNRNQERKEEVHWSLESNVIPFVSTV